MLAHGPIAHFPHKSAVIKMTNTPRRHYAGEHTLYRLDFETGIEIAKGTVGKNQPDVETDQRTASSKNKAHKTADGTVLFHTAAIVNPDQREILHIVIDFKKSDACQDVRHAVIAVPPKSDGRGQQRQLHWIGPFPFRPHPGKIEQEQNRDCDGNG